MTTTGNPRLDGVLDNYARQRVARMAPQDVLKELRNRGINSLEDLVDVAIKDFGRGGTVARTTFIYEQFVYKESRVIPDELIDAIESRVMETRR